MSASFEFPSHVGLLADDLVGCRSSLTIPHLRARLVTKTKTSCPDTAIVMSGYSQGAQVVHKAAIVLGSVMASLSSVVTFGDPSQ